VDRARGQRVRIAKLNWRGGLRAFRKYDSWLNGGSPEPIGSLAYFEALVSEVRDQPLPPGYREYLHTKVAQLARLWKETKAAAR
jgi:hypothetical protein